MNLESLARAAVEAHAEALAIAEQHAAAVRWPDGAESAWQPRLIATPPPLAR